MRQPLKTKAPSRNQTSSSISYPAPVGGWNARDALASMKETDAVILDNWFPQTSYVEIRGGYTTHATGTTGNIKTLAVYNALDGVNEMFAYTASGIYDVSSAGAVGASKLARTNGKHQYVNFGDGTSNWLIAVNGVDKPAYYDGTTWTAVDGASTPALTGVTTTTLVNVFVSKGRLYFIQKDSLSFWYLAAGAAGGALTEYDLSSVAKKGGYLVAGATWTIDAGDGSDDRVVFITSQGEAIIYSGTNPSSAASWSQVGVYELGNPIGYRCFQKYGGDLTIITQNGLFPLSAAVQSAAIDYKLALSFKIERAFNEAARDYKYIWGWETTVFPDRSAMIVNIPQAEDGTHVQYVMNTITKAWCRFTEWDAETFAVFDEELYYSSGTTVYKAWDGAADGTSDVVAYAKQAFTYFRQPGVQKQIKMFRPVLNIDGTLSFLVDIDVDFQDTELAGVATYVPPTAAVWGTSLWGSGLWGAGLTITKQWNSPAQQTGYAFAGKLKIATDSLTVQWMSTDYVYETGGIL